MEQETRFTTEIAEQPSALNAVAKYYRRQTGRQLIEKARKLLSSSARVVFTGMGTSLYAPYLIRNEFLDAFPSIEILDAGELLHFGLRGIREDTVVITVSQSGESAETRAVAKQLRGRAPLLSITNDASSTMARHSDLVLTIESGTEASISTKSYTNTLAVLLLLSAAVSGDEVADSLALLEQTADLMKSSLPDSHALARGAVEFLGSFPTLHLVARGTDLVTAWQFALIIKEGAGVFSEALSGGLFRHGPIELAGPGHNALLFASRGCKPELTWKLAREIADAGSRVVVVSDRATGTPSDHSHLLEAVIASGEIPTRYFPLLCAPFIEYFVQETALGKGREAGVFHWAQKITATE